MEQIELHKKLFPAKPASNAELAQRDAAKVEAVSRCARNPAYARPETRP